ncbi:hypothetical protein JX265_013918 [Neoarthrinium moseri]|uniref:Carboxylic ester hydrolase n=1 Tax=Neoarthrinium moseri TaxID=1658444 RepID=A0A9P9W7K3_9PEZI|nr:hypothetical protein JX265_013918 [Neoarthrinium moseri]
MSTRGCDEPAQDDQGRNLVPHSPDIKGDRREPHHSIQHAPGQQLNRPRPSNKMKLTIVASAVASILSLRVGAARSAREDSGFESSCSDLSTASFSSEIKTLFANFVPAGTELLVPGLDPSCQNSTTVTVDLCRLSLNVTTSATSDVLMEVWLPRNWTGRFLSTGNGGINGCLSYSDMAYAASLGFSSTGSNNGHSGQNGTRFLHNLEVIKDYSYRALTTSAAVGKQVTSSFYQKPHTKSYYLGCSTGGRQGFKMAQDFPDIFDGIVAGAPAFNFQGLMAWSGLFHSIIKRAGPDGFPPASSWAAIDAELMAQCDHLDGAIDGILEDPSLCNFRPEALICQAGQTDATCITGKQADTIRQFLSPVYGVNGSFVYPRMEPAPGFVSFINASYTATQFLYTDHWYKYALYSDPDFNTTYLGPENWEYSIENDPTGVRTWSGDLSQMAARGAKLIHYHGLQDSLISSASSNTYYNLLSRTMSLSTSDIDDFYRYFRISGMAHCAGGDGASAIGNRGAGSASNDPSQNVLTAVVQWVEEGIAPDAVIGSRFLNGSQALGVEYTRSHCKYPLRNSLKPGGNYKSPDDWECVL